MRFRTPNSISHFEAADCGLKMFFLTDFLISLMGCSSCTSHVETLTDFGDGLFAAFVDHIVIFSRTEVGFVMKCGSTFRERID